MKNYQVLVWMIMKIKFHHDNKKMKHKLQSKLEEIFGEMFRGHSIINVVTIDIEESNPNLLVFYIKGTIIEDGIRTRHEYTIIVKPDFMESFRVIVLGDRSLLEIIERNVREILSIEVGDIHKLHEELSCNGE